MSNIRIIAGKHVETAADWRAAMKRIKVLMVLVAVARGFGDFEEIIGLRELKASQRKEKL